MAEQRDRVIVHYNLDELESMSVNRFMQMMRDVKWGMFIQEKFFRYPGHAKDKTFKDVFFFDTKIH